MQVKIQSAPCNDSSPIIDNEQEINRQFSSAVDLEQDKIRMHLLFKVERTLFLKRFWGSNDKNVFIIGPPKIDTP